MSRAALDLKNALVWLRKYQRQNCKAGEAYFVSICRIYADRLIQRGCK